MAVVTDGKYAYYNDFTYKNWYSKLIQQGLITGVGYFGSSKLPRGNWKFPYHRSFRIGDKSSYNLVSRLFQAVNHFLTKTNAEWLIRVTEDVSINMDTFKAFLNELATLPNPSQVPVVQGQCLAKRHSFYLQGGSGFMFSRKAATLLLNEEERIINETSLMKNDDKLIGKFIESIGISPFNATSRWFLGHAFNGFANSFEALDGLSDVEECPSFPLTKNGCRPFFTKVTEIVFWHDRAPIHEFLMRSESIRESFGPDLYFFVPINKPILCKGKESTHSGYYM